MVLLEATTSLSYGDIVVLQNDRLKEIAESCSEDELKPLISLHTRCKSFRVSNCPTDIGCDVAKLPYEGRGCRISGTVMIDKLLNSQISQTDLLQLLVTVSSICTATLFKPSFPQTRK